jgi:sec-independent protein translocase protein TatC
MSLTIWGGLILSCPFILLQIWQFVAEALTEKEKKLVLFFGPISIGLFFVGIAFGYFVMIPTSMQFFLSFATDSVVPMISVSKYISYVGNMVLSFGIVFELPLAILFLVKLGIATPAFLIHYRRYAVVVIFIISAILTPPDIMSQLFMVGPLLLLYEAGIVMAKIAFPREVVYEG